jgi:hypothetical protein
MSANNATKTTNAKSTVAESVGSIANAASKASESFMTEKVAMIGFGLTAMGLFIGSFVSISKFVGSKDNWNQIKDQIAKTWGLALGGSVALFLACLLYFIQNREYIIYIILAISCLTLALSYSALAASAISRQ